MQSTVFGAEIRRLKQLKADLKWNDAVGASFNLWFDKLEYAADSAASALASLDDKVGEILKVANINELEDMYSSLIRSYSEAE